MNKLMLSLAGIMGMFGASLPATPLNDTPTQATPVGAGYYGTVENISAGGVKYTKLVKRDRSRELKKNPLLSVGNRYS